MMRWGIGVLLGLVLLSVVAWNAGRVSVEKDQPEARSTPSERVHPRDSDSASPQRTVVPQVVERRRDRIIERIDSDSSDSDNSDSDIQVIVPTSRPISTPSPRSTPSPTSTAPPPALSVPEVKVPEVPPAPDLHLPLLP